MKTMTTRAATPAVLKPRAIAQYMSRSTHSIGVDQPITLAHELMRAHGIRHLPVLDGGKLAGVLSQRDLYFLESVAGVDGAVHVEEAMSPEVYCVTPDTPLAEVTAEMASHRYGCAVVMEGHAVAGIFTTTDALRVLSTMLRERDARTPAGG